MKETVKYSTVLQDFIYPLLNADDSDEMLSKKFKLAEIIWNYCIAKEFNLPVFAELENILSQENEKDNEMKMVFAAFVEIKETDFREYKNFITKIEYRTNAAGAKSLYVESVDPAAFQKDKL